MKLTRSREHVINMGNYESVRVGAAVELNTEEVNQAANAEGKVAELSDLIGMCDEVLQAALEADIKEAIDLLPPGSNSYIQVWGKPNA